MIPCLWFSWSPVNSLNLKYSTVTAKGVLIPRLLSKRGSSRFCFLSILLISQGESGELVPQRITSLSLTAIQGGVTHSKVFVFQLVKRTEERITARWSKDTHQNLSLGPSRSSLSNGHWKSGKCKCQPLPSALELVLSGIAMLSSTSLKPMTSARAAFPEHTETIILLRSPCVCTFVISRAPIASSPMEWPHCPRPLGTHIK